MKIRKIWDWGGGHLNTKELYRLIINLPYSEKIDNFERDYSKISQDKNINKEDLDYLNKYYAIKTKWCKAFIKHYRTLGIFTNQRAESINALLKRELNKNSSLQEVIEVISSKKHESNYFNEEEIGTFLSVSRSKFYEKLNVIKYWKTQISDYIMRKIKMQIELSFNYDG